MKSRHIAALLSLTAVACGGGGPKVALRYHPPAGAIYEYGVEQRMQISMDSGPLAALGKRQMLVRLYFTQTIKGPVVGGTEVEVHFQRMTMEIPGIPEELMSRALASLQGLRGTMVVDEGGTTVRSDFAQTPGVSPDVAKRIAAGLNAVTFGFPGHPVGRGDSWTMTSALPLDEMPGLSVSTSELAQTTLTLREIGTEGSDTSVIVDIKTEFPSEPISVASEGESGTLKLEGVMSGHHVFSLTRGAILDGTVKGSMKMTFTDSKPGAAGLSMQIENENSIVLISSK